MAIEVECDFCLTSYRVKDNLEGKKIRCKECGTSIRVVDNAGTNDEDDYLDFETPRRRGNSKSNSKNQSVLSGIHPVALIGGGAVVSVAIIRLVVILLSESDDDNVKPPKNDHHRFSVGNDDRHLPVGNRQFAETETPEINRLPNSIEPPSAQSKFEELQAKNEAARKRAKAQIQELQQKMQAAKENPGAGQSSAQRSTTFGRPQSSNPQSIDSTQTDWKMTADPPKTAVSLELTKDVSISVPKNLGPDNVIFPVTPSSFVAIGNNFFPQSMMEVWDMQTRKKVGSFHGNK